MAWGFALGLHIGSFDRERLSDVFFLNAYNRRFECAVVTLRGNCGVLYVSLGFSFCLRRDLANVRVVGLRRELWADFMSKLETFRAG